MEKDPPSYTLEDLSAETGFDSRVIRSFIEQGLLRGPTSLGRYARYSDRHLVRLLAIKAIRETRGLKLSDTRQTLLCMTEAEIDALAKAARPANPPNSALDYLRSLKLAVDDTQPEQVVPRAEPRNPNQYMENENRSPDVLAAALNFENSAAPINARQVATSEIWHRFQITPDVELSVRGLQTEQQMTRMKKIANRLREHLIGGSND